MAELGSPTSPVPSPAPQWCSGSRASVSLHSTPPPAEAGSRSFQNGDGSLSPAKLDRASQVGVEQAVHSRATLVEKLECCPTTLEILQPAWELPQPLLLALGSLAWDHREKDSVWDRGRARLRERAVSRHARLGSALGLLVTLGEILGYPFWPCWFFFFLTVRWVQ